MFKKYRWNFVFVVLLVSLIGFVIFDSFLFFSIRHYLFQQTFDEVLIRANLATVILQQRQPLKMTLNADELWELTEELKKNLNSRVSIIDLTGRVITDSDVPRSQVAQMDNHLYRPEVQEALINGVGKSYRMSKTLHRKHFYLAIKFFQDGKEYGFLRLAYYAREFEKSMTKIFQFMIIANFIGLIILFFAAQYLGSLITYPILRLVKTAQRIADGDLDRTFATTRKDEIGLLSKILNELTVRLKSQIQQISDERKKLENILTQLHVGILAVDHQQKIINANSVFIDMVGASKREVIGKKIDEFIHWQQLLEAIACSLTDTCQQRGTFSFYRTGIKRFVSFQVSPIRFSDSESEGMAVLIQLQDITELKQLEAIRKNFVASASHELKTPLTAIIGYAETLKEGAIHSPENSIRFVERILNQARRLEYLVSDLLKLSQLEHDLPLEVREFLLTEVVDLVVDEFSQKAEQKQINLIREFFDRNVVVRADSELIRTALENLIDNAIKYTPQKGTVSIKVSSCEQGKVKISVCDTGIGVDAKYHERIFQRFYRVDKARSREMGGTGLGLAIVKHIIERHGSKIFIESEPGKGSCFYFEMETLSQS